jgi:dihydrofolate synthase / folylpolyglutamate synthase
MKVSPVHTDVITAGKFDIARLLDLYLDRLVDGSIVAVTSKVVSLCENRVVSPGSTDKRALVEHESDLYLSGSNEFGFHFTITSDTLIPSAGIDESNGDGDYVLWPSSPQASANLIRRHLRDRFDLSHVGALITDSTCTPLRRGTLGICLAHSGFEAVNDYVGALDLFGRPFRVSQANVAGGLAAAAVVAMGEGAESTPLCVIEDVPFVKFQDRDPSEAELGQTRIPLQMDLFAPFLTAVPWHAGRGGR